MTNVGISTFRAVVRPACTLLIVVALIGGFFTELIAPEAFLGVAILVIKYWFDAKA